ncbi:50S ribosomal protein L1 [bacterium]|jgi:large subunit ribosomal protein L1|nr:50S ribosomal protein L1 [bacterium]NBX78148.1 50S ribosomal protein L1 [bacterium]
MAKSGKKYKKARELVDANQLFASKDVFAKIKEVAFAKFDESVDVDVNLGIDATKGDQVVRGSVVLPHGNGRSVKVAVFAKGDYAEQALKGGADYVGADDLIEKILSGWIDFNYTVATPDMMGAVGKLAKILGPKGLLPNKKLGTVTLDIAPVVAELKSGKTFFKNDKNGLVHFSIGKVSFDAQKLHDNFMAFVKVLATSKPSTSKGKFIRKISCSSTMGVGFPVNLDDVA